MLIDDIAKPLSSEQKVYSVDITQIRKRNASLVLRLVACSFNFLQAKSLSSRNTIPCLGENFSLFRTEASQIVCPL